MPWQSKTESVPQTVAELLVFMQTKGACSSYMQEVGALDPAMSIEQLILNTNQKIGISWVLSRLEDDQLKSLYLNWDLDDDELISIDITQLREVIQRWLRHELTDEEAQQQRRAKREQLTVKRADLWVTFQHKLIAVLKERQLIP